MLPWVCGCWLMLLLGLYVSDPCNHRWDRVSVLGHGNAHIGDWPYNKSATLPSVDLGPGLQAVGLAAGVDHTCALLQPGGLVKCWG